MQDRRIAFWKREELAVEHLRKCVRAQADALRTAAVADEEAALRLSSAGHQQLRVQALGVVLASAHRNFKVGEQAVEDTRPEAHRLALEALEKEQELLQVAASLEADTRKLVKRLIALAEPCIILIMGLVVGFIVVAMLMAILSVTDIPL